jgi:hypothetical protein
MVDAEDLDRAAIGAAEVVLPAPLTPTRPNDSPAWTVRLKPPSATDWPKRLRTSAKRSAG